MMKRLILITLLAFPLTGRSATPLGTASNPPVVQTAAATFTIQTGVTTTFNSGSITTFASGSTVNFTGATVNGLGSAASDTAFASSWNGVTTIPPTKNAVYDYVHLFDTDDDGKVNVLDLAAGIPKTDSSGVLSLAVAGTDYPGLSFGNVFTLGQTIDTGSNGDSAVEGLILRNDTLSTNAVRKQNAPIIVFEAHGYDTDDTHADKQWEMSEDFEVRRDLDPEAGLARFSWKFSLNEGVYVEKSYIDSGGGIGALGYITSVTGFGVSTGGLGATVDVYVAGNGLGFETPGSARLVNYSAANPMIFNSVTTTQPAFRFFGGFDTVNSLTSGTLIYGMVPNTGFTGDYFNFGRTTDYSTISASLFRGDKDGNLIIAGGLTIGNPLGAAYGGTGIANNAAATLTRSGNHALTLTTTGTTGVTLPTSGTLATTAGTEVPLTFSTGLTRTTNTVSVNTVQNIARLSNLTTNGFITTKSSDGSLDIDTTSYIQQSWIDTDGTLAANSDTKVATQKAVKTYVDANAGGNPFDQSLNTSDIVSFSELIAPAAQLTGRIPNARGLYELSDASYVLSVENDNELHFNIGNHLSSIVFDNGSAAMFLSGLGAIPITGSGTPSCSGATIGSGSTDNAGFVTATTTGVSTIVVTFSRAATTGWSIVASNNTTANLVRQSAKSTTTATFTGTTVTGDVLSYIAIPY